LSVSDKTVNNHETNDSLLGSYRVLDLTDDKGLLCGKILGDLGADVIKIEKPGGDPSRNIGPFYGDVPDPEKSLSWFAFNANKRGITLNIESSDGRDILRKLVKGADFVIESFPPGYMKSLGLDYASLTEINSRIIMTSISPFGQTGPYRDYKGPDLAVWALSGVMSLTGDRDRAPVRPSFAQSNMHAGAGAAAASMVALYWREITGEGQHVDVSMQEMSTPAMLSTRLFWDLNRSNLQRDGPYRVGLSAKTKQRLTWPCRDGFVCFILVGGAIGAKANKALVKWMDEEGMASDYLNNKDWVSFDQARVNQDEIDRISQPIARFFLKQSKAELYSEAVKRHIQLYPVYTPEEIAKDKHLHARQFWVKVEHEELGTALTYPGAFAKLSETPCRIWRRAPLIGEHNEEIYQRELNLSQEELSALKQAGII